jgi:hypothetical protein
MRGGDHNDLLMILRDGYGDKKLFGHEIGIGREISIQLVLAFLSTIFIGIFAIFFLKRYQSEQLLQPRFID